MTLLPPGVKVHLAFGYIDMRKGMDSLSVLVQEVLQQDPFTKSIRREMRRRAAVKPVIGHVKAEHRMGRNYLKGRDGDRANAVLAAAGYNFSLLVRWFEALLRAFIAALLRTPFAAQIA